MLSDEFEQGTVYTLHSTLNFKLTSEVPTFLLIPYMMFLLTMIGFPKLKSTKLDRLDLEINLVQNWDSFEDLSRDSHCFGDLEHLLKDDTQDSHDFRQIHLDSLKRAKDCKSFAEFKVHISKIETKCAILENRLLRENKILDHKIRDEVKLRMNQQEDRLLKN